MGDKSAPIDLEISRIAALQHGVITHRQLAKLGLSRNGISMRVRRGALHRVHRGVYAVGHPPISQEAHWMAAVLACGRGAVLSHGSAAALWGLLRPISGPVHVSVPSHGGRSRRQGLRVHRVVSLAADPRPAVLRDRIPVTGVARTISDLRGSVPPRLVRRATRQAEILRLLDGEPAGDRTRSDLESDFLRLCHRHRLPTPEVNVWIGPHLVDFLWPDCRVVVETDHYRYHRGQQAFRDDHARDLDLRRRGFDVIRLSEEQVNEGPDRVAATLRETLAPAP